MRRLNGRVLCALFSITCFATAEGKCRSDQVETRYGLVSHKVCRDAQKKYTHTVSLAGIDILKDDFLAEDDNNKNRSLWVYSGKTSAATGCADIVYLIDVSAKPVKAFSFGVKNACSEFGWASWGDKRSVISLKKNVSFVYENGKLTPPKAGPQLWKAIEPPHAGPGLKEEDAVPFVQELAMPAVN
jgi:hypothetical protein